MALEFPVIDPVALALGPFQIRWYALAYLAGFLIGWRYCLRLAGFDGGLRPNREDIDDFLTWVVIGVVLGGRFGSVLFYNLNYHVQNPFVDLTLPFVNWVISFPSVLAIWQGGMSFHGGALGVIAALFIYPRLKKFPPLPLCDIVCAAVPIGLFFGRIANFINAELYGRVTDAPWGIVFPNGGEQPRHPSQLYEAFFEGAVLFIILFFLIRNEHVRKRPGIVAGAFLAGYGLFRGCIEFYREPDAHIGLYFDLFSQGQLLSFPMVLVGFGVIVFACYSHKQRML
ncbi:MAG: prolipoprotein diacylglyceryl transferase [Bdellovibrionales bacterium]